MADPVTLDLPVRERPAAAAPVSIENLPNELLSHILSFLDGPAAPSEARLHDQPSARVFGPGDDGNPAPAGLLPSPLLQTLPLKSASMVSRRWHAVSLPILFRHVVWPVDRWDLLLVEQEPDHVAAIPLLDFIRTHALGPSVVTFTMVVADSLAGMYRLQAEDEIDRAHEPKQQQQDHDEGHSSSSSSSKSTGSSSGRRISLVTALRMVDDEPGLERSATYNEDNNWLWDAVFSLVDPLRFTVLASPRMLASLLSRMVFLGDAWSFGSSLHMLSLSRKKRGDANRRCSVGAATLSRKGKEKETAGQPEPGGRQEEEEEEEEDQPQASSASTAPAEKPVPSSSKASKNPRGLQRVPCNLFTIRPWKSLLLNEGSSARVYSAYEFYTKRPPSILPALLGTDEFPNDESLIPPTIHSLSYVAVFPLSGHFNTLIRNLPPVDRLFVQIVPRDDDDVFSDVLARQSPIDPQDLWIERNTAYSMVIRAMMDGRRRGNWRRLLEFESGDAADREAWELAVQYIRLAGRAWRVAGDGIFCRREDYEEGDNEGRDHGDGDDDDDDNDDDDQDDELAIMEMIGVTDEGVDDGDEDDDDESVVEIIEMHGGSNQDPGPGGGGGGGGGGAGGGTQDQDGEPDSDEETGQGMADSPFLSVP